MVAALPLPEPGDVLTGRYILQARIGEGGMGIVFRAEQPALARTVAIKILHPELAAHPGFARRFRDEARAASRVRHPGSVSILDCDVTAEGVPFIAMEHVGGRALGRIVAEQELPLPRVLAIADQLLGALAAVHACGVVHADVKSDNFLVDVRPDGDAVKLIDFGLAVIDGRWAPSGFVSGTPEYMAPELIHGGPPTIATDLYGAGVILYEMLTGGAPFTGASSQEILTRQLEDDVIPPSLRQPDRGIPAALDEIAVRALDKDPRRRFASAEAFAAALRAIRPARAPLTRVVRIDLARSRSDAPTRPCGVPPLVRQRRGWRRAR
jgi:serine/threonine-protein kinase